MTRDTIAPPPMPDQGGSGQKQQAEVGLGKIYDWEKTSIQFNKDALKALGEEGGVS